MVETLLSGIVGFRVAVTRLEAKWKLNQNHPNERRERVIRALEAEGGEDALAIAEAMRPVALMTTVSLDVTGRLLLGTDAAAVLSILAPLHVDVVAFNCSTGP